MKQLQVSHQLPYAPESGTYAHGSDHVCVCSARHCLSLASLHEVARNELHDDRYSSLGVFAAALALPLDLNQMHHVGAFSLERNAAKRC